MHVKWALDTSLNNPYEGEYGIKVLDQNSVLLQDKEPYNYIQSIRRDQIIIGIYLFGHIAASLAVVSVPPADLPA